MEIRMPMNPDTLMSEKIRRRLVPMIVERRIGEPAVTRAEAFEGGDTSYVVTVRHGATAKRQGTDLMTDLSRALADLGPGVVVSIEAV
jgi:hypothetical protein